MVYPTATGPQCVVAGDFNGDGRPDLAVAAVTSSKVSVLLANGPPNAGTFQPAVDYAVGSGAISLALDDFDGDTKLDLAVSSQNVPSQLILYGNGGGMFTPVTRCTIGLGGLSVAAGDFNADGRPDLSYVTFLDNNLWTVLAKADGTYETPVVQPVATTPRAVCVGDFNKDGRVDLAVASSAGNNPSAPPNTVSIMLGNAAPNLGTFAAGAPAFAGVGSFAIAVGDLNADGKQDLAVANSLSNNVSVLIGNGDATFQAATNYPVTSSARSIAIGDLNGDGIADLASGNFFSGTVAVLLGNGAPNAGTFQPAVHFAVGSNPRSVAIADFNGDGRFDLAVVNSVSHTVSILLNTTSSNPWVEVQPAPDLTCASGTASFVVTARAGAPVAFQWQRESSPGSNQFSDLPGGSTAPWDGGAPWIGGVVGVVDSALSSTLSIAADTANGRKLAGMHAGRFRCVVSNSCGSTTSEPAQLTLCLADLTCDDVVDDADFVAFVVAYNLLVCEDPTMSPGCASDMNADGVVDDADFSVFVLGYDRLVCE